MGASRGTQRRGGHAPLQIEIVRELDPVGCVVGSE